MTNSVTDRTKELLEKLYKKTISLKEREELKYLIEKQKSQYETKGNFHKATLAGMLLLALYKGDNYNYTEDIEVIA